MPTTYEPIATNTLGSATGTVTFSSISSAYTDLRVVLTGTVSSGTIIPGMTFNGTTTGYSYTNLSGNGSSASSARTASQAKIDLGYQTGFSSGTISTIAVDIFSYTGGHFKNCLVSTSMDKNGSGAIERFAGLWQNGAAITSITFTSPAGTFATGTSFTLYGILKA